MRVLPRNLAVFAAFAATMALTELWVARLPVFASRAVPIAMFVDLVMVLPFTFAVAVLRPARRSMVQALPVVGIGLAAAAVLLSGRAETRLLLKVAGGVVEVGVLAMLARRLLGGGRELRSAASDDVIVRMSALSDPVLRAAGLELAIAYYAFIGPFRRRETESAYGYVETSGAFGLLLAVGLLVAFEGIPVHVILAAHSAAATWLHLAADLYALVWLVAAYQAARLRPVVLSADRLLVRTSLLWTADVPRDAIAAVSRIYEVPTRGGRPDRSVLRACFGTTPELLISLRGPVVARGLFGIKRPVTAIALHVDEPGALRDALAAPSDAGLAAS